MKLLVGYTSRIILASCQNFLNTWTNLFLSWQWLVDPSPILKWAEWQSIYTYSECLVLTLNTWSEDLLAGSFFHSFLDIEMMKYVWLPIYLWHFCIACFQMNYNNQVIYSFVIILSGGWGSIWDKRRESSMDHFLVVEMQNSSW